MNIPYGEYEIREIDPPKGYRKTDEVFKVSVRENGEVITLDIENYKIPKKPFIPSLPKTGDESNMMLWAVVMGASAAALVSLGIAGKRRKMKEKTHGA